MKIFIPVALILAPFFASAQDTSRQAELKVSQDALHKTVQLEFVQVAQVENLLVHVSDSTGRTIFLENKYRFSGPYKSLVDMKGQAKGTYYLQIIKDNQPHINRKIIIQ